MRSPFRSWPRILTRPEPAGGYVPAAIAGAGVVVAAVAVLAAVLGRWPSPLTWYLARASGLTLYLLLWAATLLGFGLTAVRLRRWASRAVVHSLHGFATGLAYAFLALHLLSLAADPTVRFDAVALAIPFAAGWREPWTGVGVVAAWLLATVGLSAGLRRWTGYAVWRRLHDLTPLLYLLALLHGLGAGTDAVLPWARAVYLATATTVVGFAIVRVRRRGRRMPPPAPSAPPFDQLSPRRERPCAS